MQPDLELSHGIGLHLFTEIKELPGVSYLNGARSEPLFPNFYTTGVLSLEIQVTLNEGIRDAAVRAVEIFSNEAESYWKVLPLYLKPLASSFVRHSRRSA